MWVYTGLRLRPCGNPIPYKPNLLPPEMITIPVPFLSTKRSSRGLPNSAYTLIDSAKENYSVTLITHKIGLHSNIYGYKIDP